jgi:NTE family protein
VVEFGANLGVSGQARAGWFERKTHGSVETGSPILPGVEQRVGGPRGTIAIDTYDFAFFPTRGYKIDAEVYDAQRVSDGQGKYGRAIGRVGGALTIGEMTILGAAERGKSTHGTLPASELLVLGGPRRLAGFAPGQIRGDDLSYAGLDLQYKLTRPIPLLGFSMIGGVQAEAGRMKMPAFAGTSNGWQQSYGVYLAANTVLGPIYFGYADAKNGRGHLYFFIGTP